MEIQEKIECYFSGELNDKQENKLWVLFLKDPEWYNYFITYLNLMALARKGYKTLISSDGETQ